QVRAHAGDYPPVPRRVLAYPGGPGRPAAERSARRRDVAGKGRAVRMAVLYGPMVAEAARKYGPAVWDQLKTQRAPVEKLVQSKAARGNQREKALAPAATLVNGSVIQVFHRNDPHWVVFSGEEPIAVHPQTTEPF